MSKYVIAWISSIFGSIYTSAVWGTGMYHLQCIPCNLFIIIVGIGLLIAIGYIFGNRYNCNDSKTSEIQAVSLMGLLLGAGYSSLVWAAFLYEHILIIMLSVVGGIALFFCAVTTLLEAIKE